MKAIHLFAGAGLGMSASPALGHVTEAAVELDPWRRDVLSVRFPGVRLHDDVRTYSPDISADIVCGGWPCQDISPIGKGKGMARDSDTRSALFWQLLRILNESGAEWLWSENVSALLDANHERDFHDALVALSESGFGGYYTVVSSEDAGGLHLRKRFWMLAKKGHTGFERVFYPSKSTVGAKRWPTPRVGGRGSVKFLRKDGIMRDDLETVQRMHHLGVFDRDPTPAQAQEVSRLYTNADWAESLMGLRVGWTNPNVGSDFLSDQWPILPPRTHNLVGMAYGMRHLNPNTDESALNSRRLEAIGDGQDPRTVKLAYEFLMARF